MMSILSESASGKKTNLIISKNVFFGIYAIIDQIHLRIPLKPRVRKIKEKLEGPNPLLPNKIKIFILGIHRTSWGHLKVWSKIDKFDLSGLANQN